MLLGETLGLVHNEVCKDSYRKWSKQPTLENKTAMIKAKADCKLCHFKNQLRKDQIKAVKVGN